MPHDDTAWSERAARALRVLSRRSAGASNASNDPVSMGRQAQPTAGAVSQPEREREVEDVIGDCARYEGGRRQPGRLPLSEAAHSARHTGGFVWIGMQQPSAAAVAAVATEFVLPALAVEDAVKAHQRPKLEVYGDVVFVVLKPVRYVDHDEVVDVSEIAVFLGPNFVVTVRHGDSDVLRRIRAELDEGGTELAQLGAAGVLYRAADLTVDGYEQAIEQINEDVDHIEARVFGSGDSDDNSERIYKLKREIAEFRHAAQPLAVPLQRLAETPIPQVGTAAAEYFRDVHDHVLRATDAIEAHDRLLSDVLQADLARVSARLGQIAVRQNEIAVRQNEDMRKISAWAAIALVPTAIAGIYGMNFHNMPELRWRYGYFLVLAVMVTVCVVLNRLFRRNGWL